MIVPILIYRSETWALKICFLQGPSRPKQKCCYQKRIRSVQYELKTPSLQYQSDHLGKTEDHILNTLYQVDEMWADLECGKKDQQYL